MRTASFVVGLVALAGAPAAHAQAAYDSPAGRVVVLGLQRWSVPQLERAIQKERPGLALNDGACVAVMRHRLGFPDASVAFTSLVDFDGSVKRYVVIKVVEPEDSARVRWRPAPGNEFGSLRPDYAPVVLPVTDSAGGFWTTRLSGPVQFYPRGVIARAEALEANPPMRADAERIWAWLETRTSERDRRMALEALADDGVYANRVVAAMVLANFPEHDATWLALVEALRDPHEHVRSMAQLVLANLPEGRRVDWTPALATLRLLVGGTNVHATETVLLALARTQVDPSHRARLLRDNAAWVRAHLRAEEPGASRSAHAFLRQINGGRDLGPTPSAWEGFLAGR